MDAFASWIGKLSASRRDDPEPPWAKKDGPSSKFDPLGKVTRVITRLFAKPSVCQDQKAMYSAWYDSPLIKLRREMGKLLSIAAQEAIRLAASEPSVARVVEAAFLAMEPQFIEVLQHRSRDETTGMGYWSFKPRFHQMLGHAPSSQIAVPAESKVVCLLQLATDNGVGMSFGDLGEAAFWISEEDLIAAL